MRYKDFLGSLPGLIAGLVGASVVLTAVAELAYHLFMDSPFFYFNSPTDFAILSLFYMTVLVIGGFPLIGFWIIGFRVTNDYIRAFLVCAVLLIIISIVIFVMFPASGVSIKNTLWIYGIYIIWEILVILLIMSPVLLDKLTIHNILTLYGLLTYIPFIMILFIVIGVHRASVDLSSTQGNYQVVYSNDAVEDNIRLLRTMS